MNRLAGGVSFLFGFVHWGMEWAFGLRPSFEESWEVFLCFR
jgi:hypothetical protein